MTPSHEQIAWIDPSAPIADDNISGERFGKYVLVGEIAVGGMAEVFLGVRMGLEGFLKVVVLKRVLPHYSGNEQFVRMFVDEARLAARLDHPNIVRTYEFGEVDGQYFTVMEYLPGEDLRSMLRRLSQAKRKLPLHVAAGIVTQVCAGLHCAHQLTDTAGRALNLVHRDINPANIIITYGGEVKIIDFGVAKTNTTATVAGTIKGKIAYMPPEQLLSRGVDQRSDIFSAGVVLWELLTGRRLFGRTTEAATLYAIMNDPIPAPSRYRPEIPRALDLIVARALSRTPADRFETAEEMGAALDAFLADQPKCDARLLAATVEEVFGAPRATAKRAIAQTRSLGHNISLVMKLRTDVRAELAASLNSFATGSGTNLPDVDEQRSSFALLLGVFMLVCIGGGIAFITNTSDAHVAPVATAPRVDSETIRVEPVKRPSGRLVLADLPRGATFSVDGTEYQAGELVDVKAGTHEVLVRVAGKAVVTQQLETTGGDQIWKLAGGRLVGN